MSNRRGQPLARGRAVIVTLAIVATVASMAACVPAPANRRTPAPAASTAPPSRAPTPTVGPATPTPEPSFTRPTPLPEPTFLAYLVKPGDTLTSIAREFSTTPVSIGYWNRATYPTLDPDSAGYAPDRIAVGWTLLLIPDRVLDGSDLPDSVETPDPVDAATAEPS